MPVNVFCRSFRGPSVLRLQEFKYQDGTKLARAVTIARRRPKREYDTPRREPIRVVCTPLTPSDYTDCRTEREL